MSTKRKGCAAIALDRWQVLVVGGNNETSSLNSTEILHLGSGAFAPGPSMMSARRGCGIVRLDKDRIMIIGGRVGYTYLDSTEIFSTTTFKFTAGPKLLSRRHGCAAVMTKENQLMVIGGNSGRDHLDTTEVLSLSDMTFRQGPPMAIKRTACSAVMIDEDQLLVMGGSDGTARLNTCELLDISDSRPQFQYPSASMDMCRSEHTAIIVPNFPPDPSARTGDDAERERWELITAVFKTCTSADGHTSDEITQADWSLISRIIGSRLMTGGALDFQDLCGGNPGMSLNDFAALMNERGGRFFATSFQLSKMLRELCVALRSF